MKKGGTFLSKTEIVNGIFDIIQNGTKTISIDIIGKQQALNTLEEFSGNMNFNNLFEIK